MPNSSVTVQRCQTKAREYMRTLRLSALVSPYFQRSDLKKVGSAGRDTSISSSMKYIVYQLGPDQCDFNIYNGTTLVTNDFVVPGVSEPVNLAVLQAAAVPLMITKMTGLGYTITASDILFYGDPAIADIVSGVAKAGTYAVTAAPVVAGGAGVARFYIDSNGDGTGTAPSEVYTPSLQAVIVNSAASYVVTGVSVDTNRKYIDVTMKALSFAGITVVGISVLGSQSLVAAANGIVVNCLVLVKK